MEKKRLHNLDYLRGVAASVIMIYHLSSWVFGRHDADTFLGKSGVYGVSVFYILSGLTLFYVYNKSLNFDLKNISKFFIKRVFRIFPLLWVATILGVLYKGNIPDFLDLFLNLTGLFGFFKWDVTFSTGVWSIGNELVFYSLFPFIIFLLKKHPFYFYGMGVLIAMIYLYFSFYVFIPGISGYEQRSAYFNPLNNLFFFWGGIFIGNVFSHRKFSKGLLLSLFMIAIGVYLFYPLNPGGGRLELLSGWNRMILSICSFMFVLFFYKSDFNKVKYISKPLLVLGEISYSLYLMHTFGYKIALLFSFENKIIVFLLSIIFSVLISWVFYNYFEKLFVNFCRNKVIPFIS